MKTRYLIVGIITLISCKPNLKKHDIPDSNLLNETIIEVVKQDSLNTNLPIYFKLSKYYIVTVDHNSVLAPPHTEEGEPLIIEYFGKRQKFYTGYTISHEDSIFIKRQIDNARNLKLDSIEFQKIITISDLKNWSQQDFNSKRFYRFNIPIFNSDKTLVWIEYGYMCKGCGSGKMVILKKENGSWKKINSYKTWMN